jgi:heme-degrading monooxygenase HmoA/ketosteroid isomerase-like protein
MRHVIVFRSRLRDGVADEYGPHAEKIYDLAIHQPGFLAVKDFVAEDGERLALVEWASSPELAAWRELADHRAAQERGRAHYYAEYSLQVCTELRASQFVAASGVHVRRTSDTRPLAERWLACFEARDLDGLLALYADDATHTSPKIRERHPETGGKLLGKAAMRAWWADSFVRLPTMRYLPTQITAGPDSVLLEYMRHVDGEPDLPIAEVFDVRDGYIVASRVFHG